MVSRTSAPGPFPSTAAPARESSAGWLHAHCDGGARGNPGPAGYGALLVDDAGAPVAELSEFLGLRTNNFAEYSGLLGCLQYALDHGHRRLKVVSDSELMVKQIQGKYQVKSPDLKPLFDEARRRIAKLDSFEISHALRHKNKEADRLANEAMDRGMHRGGVPRAAIPARKVVAATKTDVPQRMPTTPIPIVSSAASGAPAAPLVDAMLRGFTRDGVVHVLGGQSLPDGIFVKVIPE